MDELVISDRRYISTRRAGKEHGYHSDYIGQLIRGGKVQGQKVGRSWYVDAESLASYLGKEYSTSVGETATKTTALEEVSMPVAEPMVEVKPEPVADVVVEETPTPQISADRGPDQSVGVKKEEAEVIKEEKIEAPVVVAEVPAEGEETRIPIHKPMAVSAMPEVHHTKEPVVESENTMGTLKYIPDEEPMLPPVEVMPVVEAAHTRATLIVPPKINRRLGVARAAVALAVAVVLVGLTAAAAGFISSTTRVVGEGAATVFYSFGQ